MNNQQLIETIHRVIKNTINEKYPKAGEKGNIYVRNLKKGDILGGSGLEVISVSAGAKTPSDKVEVTVKDPKSGKEITKIWGKNTVVKVKSDIDEAGPATAPSKPKETPGPAVAPGKPSTDKPKPRRPLGNPNVKPEPKATMTEADMLAKIIKRFRSKNIKENQTDVSPDFIKGYKDGYYDGLTRQPLKY